MAKIKREIKILKSLEHPSIINLEAVLLDPGSKTFALVPLLSLRPSTM
jgi:serine/threonine protein kinase